MDKVQPGRSNNIPEIYELGPALAKRRLAAFWGPRLRPGAGPGLGPGPNPIHILLVLILVLVSPTNSS